MNKKPNILIFGGTTEGKKAAWLLDHIEQPYLYSTKTITSHIVEGKHITGALSDIQIVNLCKKNNVKLIIDAAHPFAEELHFNVLSASKMGEIETIRFERIFTDLSQYSNVQIFKNYKYLADALIKSKYNKILALTGVQTIEKLDSVWKTKECVFRILDTELSKEIAKKTGIAQECIIAANPEKDTQSFIQLIEDTKADIILSKESGNSGFFTEKIEAAIKVDIPMWVISRPEISGYTYLVHSSMELQSTIYKLRKTVLKPKGKELAKGYTTGSSVTAAAKASFVSLFERELPKTIDITLPIGTNVEFITYPERLSATQAQCKVIKNAGDDPDIMHGEEIGCKISLCDILGINFIKGDGVGVVTLPGLPIAKGEPAINPGPRKMVKNELKQLAKKYNYKRGIIVEPFIPNGEELAEKTFNSRIGIIGGLSILGTSGVVEPYSNEAFLASIKEQLNVTKALNCDSVVLTSGLRSENIIKAKLPEIPQQAFVHFGNLVGDTVKLCKDIGFKNIYIGLMLGKAIKLAEGNLNTHSKKATFNSGFAAQIAKDSNYSEEIQEEIKKLKMANAIFDFIPYSSNEPYYKAVIEKCTHVCNQVSEANEGLHFYLIIENKKSNS